MRGVIVYATHSVTAWRDGAGGRCRVLDTTEFKSYTEEVYDFVTCTRGTAQGFIDQFNNDVSKDVHLYVVRTDVYPEIVEIKGWGSGDNGLGYYDFLDGCRKEMKRQHEFESHFYIYHRQANSGATYTSIAVQKLGQAPESINYAEMRTEVIKQLGREEVTPTPPPTAATPPPTAQYNPATPTPPMAPDPYKKPPMPRGQNTMDRPHATINPDDVPF